VTGDTTTESRKDRAPDRDVGILFVHGIGAQKRGETLSAFGAPVYRWLEQRFLGVDRRWQAAAGLSRQEWRRRIEDWATDGFEPESGPESGADGQDAIARLAEEVGSETVVGRAHLADAVISDPEDPGAPAHAELRLRRQRTSGELETERWLLAESWWAETFTPPGFREMVRWGMSVLPWTIGSHFGARVRRVLARPPDTAGQRLAIRVLRRLGWAAGLVASFVGLFVALMLSPFLLVAFAGLLLVALVPIPVVRETLLKIQLKIASTLGDSFVLLTRPIEAASIVGQVRRDLSWLAGRCKRVIVVAHSQGGAVAHKALQKGAPGRLRLLFTFGSGLKKLEQLDYLLASGGSYRLSAALTLVALPLVGLTLAWLVWAMLGGLAKTDEPLVSVFWMIAWLGGSLIVLIAGLRDLVRGIAPDKLKRWTRRLEKTDIAWTDCFASADPVSNGVLLDEPAIEARSREVCNESSMLKDHTSYWTNRDEFVTALMDQVARARSRPGEFETDAATLDWLGARRRWRIGIRSALFWSFIVSVAVAIAQMPQAYRHLVTYWVAKLSSWALSLVGGEPRPPGEFAVAWPAIGWLALVSAPYLVTGLLWRRWNEEDMLALIRDGRKSGRYIPVLTGLWAQLVVIVGLARGEFPPYWLFTLLMLAVVVPAVALEPASPSGRRVVESDRKPGERRSHGESAWTYVRDGFSLLMSLVLVPYFVGLAGWNGLIRFAERFAGGSILGFRPESIDSFWAGAVLALVFVVATGVAAFLGRDAS
jgi:hypothetical protein